MSQQLEWDVLTITEETDKLYEKIVAKGGRDKLTLTREKIIEARGWQPSIYLTKDNFGRAPSELGCYDVATAAYVLLNYFQDQTGTYRQLASRLISALVRSGTGRRFRDAQTLGIDLPGGRVIVEPDEMAELPGHI